MPNPGSGAADGPEKAIQVLERALDKSTQGSTGETPGPGWVW